MQDVDSQGRQGLLLLVSLRLRRATSGPALPVLRPEAPHLPGGTVPRAAEPLGASRAGKGGVHGASWGLSRRKRSNERNG